MNFTKKTGKMKLLSFLIIFISLLFGTQAAWGLLYGANEVKNGDFEVGNLSYWTSSLSVGAYQVEGYGNWVAGIINSASGAMHQVIDESAYPGWDPLGTAKLWSFKGAHAEFGPSSVRFALYYYPTNPQNKPDFDPNSWINFLDQTFYESGYYQAEGTIYNFQPRWVAVQIQFACQGMFTAAVVDNIDFEAKCTAPLPGTALLLSSGLIGLAWRRVYGRWQRGGRGD